MRVALSLTLAGLLLTLGQLLALASSPADVLNLLQGMNLSPEFTAALSAALTAGFSSGRATPANTLLLLQTLQKIEPEKAERILEIVRYALAQGFIVDPGPTGSSLVNEALKLFRFGRSAEEVEGVLSARVSLLVSTRSVLSRYGLITVGPVGPGVPLTPQDRLVLELAWAVGDLFLWKGRSPEDPQFLPDVQKEVNRMVGLGVVKKEAASPVLAALTPEMLQEIVRLAFPRERR